MMRIRYDGNVGIGTNDPLHGNYVAGNGHFTGNQITIDPSTDYSYFTGTSGTTIFQGQGATRLTAQNGPIVFHADTSGGLAERMRIASDGNIGIGTDTPGYLLDLRRDVASSSGNKNEVGVNIVNEAYYSGTYLRVGRANGGLRINYSREFSSTLNTSSTEHHGEHYTSSGGLDIGTVNTPRLSITSGGNVGIGLTNPQHKLDVNGGVAAAFDTDTTSYFGRAALGYAGHSDEMTISHIDRNNPTDYALLQTAMVTQY